MLFGHVLATQVVATALEVGRFALRGDGVPRFAHVHRVLEHHAVESSVQRATPHGQVELEKGGGRHVVVPRFSKPQTCLINCFQ